MGELRWGGDSPCAAPVRAGAFDQFGFLHRPERAPYGGVGHVQRDRRLTVRDRRIRGTGTLKEPEGKTRGYKKAGSPRKNKGSGEGGGYEILCRMREKPYFPPVFETAR